MKLINVQTYPIKDVPDHLTQECGDLGIEFVKTIQELCSGKNPNIILGAAAFLQSALIKELVSDKIEEQKLAARMGALALIKNVYFLNGLDFDKEMEK